MAHFVGEMCRAGWTKRLRELAGVTQEELADRLGVSRREVIRWENGKTVPGRWICDAYDEILCELEAMARQRCAKPYFTKVGRLLVDDDLLGGVG